MTKKEIIYFKKIIADNEITKKDLLNNKRFSSAFDTDKEKFEFINGMDYAIECFKAYLNIK